MGSMSFGLFYHKSLIMFPFIAFHYCYKELLQFIVHKETLRNSANNILGSLICSLFNDSVTNSKVERLDYR
jgi:hypothetical protein